ncbi:hypothetical protein CANARDRAFT_21147 [[Candida] arabinofermentans NRRL YB-2248]|uniref:Large ribosomal subunit protein uL11m n=1 Tax=[Candida] arabinofermentans NRRL YB-2248 TaxID=983967 RepID=A0A1E4T5Z0_9ASCO|nr:hypothetical protein CANARDRAFT_21147 [[Candida] arabinofermentans NRRL YB-2248]
MSQLKNIPIKLIVAAGQAAPTPPVGPALGSKGVKAIDFCKEFNARTAQYQPGTPIPTKIIVKPDRSFSFEVKSPSTSWLLKQVTGLEKGSDILGKGKMSKTPAAEISLKHVYEIAKIKKMDGTHSDIPLIEICKSVISTATCLGIKVVE